MRKFFTFLLFLIFIALLSWFIWSKTKSVGSKTEHRMVLERIEAMGRLELVKYRFSDILEHTNRSTYLPDASVLLIVKADAVGCVDLTKLSKEDVQVFGDSVSIALPKAELCYVKIDHKASKVYDTKMAFFREAKLVDEAFKGAEEEITRQVKKSDILKQTESNAMHVFKPLLEGLGFKKIHLSFQ